MELETAKPEIENSSNGETFKLQDHQLFLEEIDSSCSTPFVSAPSSPGRGPVGFFYSAPASPMHFMVSSTAASQPISSSGDALSVSGSFEFDFSARLASSGPGDAGGGSMCSADELFFNGQIRPMKLSTHLQRPQVLAPLLDAEEGEEIGSESVEAVRGRDLRLRDRSLRRRTRSMSPLRSLPFLPWQNDDETKDLKAKELEFDKIGLELKSKEGKEEDEARGSIESSTPSSMSASSSRSSSAGRSSKRWVFLKDFLYRSKSEGRSSSTKLWSSIGGKEKKPATVTQLNLFSSSKEKVSSTPAESKPQGSSKESKKKKKTAAGKLANGVGKRRVPPSPHELHYTANRAQAEELRKKTFLPYRQGLLGCLGFSSKSYGAINGFARALNPVSSG